MHCLKGWLFALQIPKNSGISLKKIQLISPTQLQVTAPDDVTQ